MTTNPLREAITLAGEQAFRDGRRIYTCPYPVETQKAFWWFEGYQKGWLKDVFSDVEAVMMEHGNNSRVVQPWDERKPRKFKKVNEGTWEKIND